MDCDDRMRNRKIRIVIGQVEHNVHSTSSGTISMATTLHPSLSLAMTAARYPLPQPTSNILACSFLRLGNKCSNASLGEEMMMNELGIEKENELKREEATYKRAYAAQKWSGRVL